MTDGQDRAPALTDEERLRNSERRQRFRVRLGDAIRSLPSAELIQAATSRLLLDHLGASRVHYAELEPNEAHAVAPADHPPYVPDRAGRYSLADFPALLSTLRAGHGFVASDLAAHPKVGTAEKARFAAPPVAAIVVAPLVRGARLAGLLAVHRAAPHAWSSEEIALIEDTAERTWIAIERARRTAPAGGERDAAAERAQARRAAPLLLRSPVRPQRGLEQPSTTCSPASPAAWS